MKYSAWIKFACLGIVAVGAPVVLAACSDGGTGSSTSSTGAGSGGGATGGDFVTDGFVKTGPWTGYGFTVIDTLMEGSTVTPNCPTDGSGCMPAFMGNTFCMKGSVAADKDYNGFALLGWSVSQDQMTSTIGAWAVPASGGVTITVTNPMNAPLRVQLQIPAAATNDDRYCATLVSGKQLKWTDFKTQCWGTAGKALTAGTMIENAAVQVFGTNTAAVPFDVCITGMKVE